MPKVKQTKKSDNKTTKKNDKVKKQTTVSPLKAKKVIQKKMKEEVGGIKKPYRHRPGVTAEREIRKEQKSNKPAIPKASFARIFKQILAEMGPPYSEFRVQKETLEALQQEFERAAIDFYKSGYNNTQHANRITIQIEDLRRVVQTLVDGSIQMPALYDAYMEHMTAHKLIRTKEDTVQKILDGKISEKRKKRKGGVKVEKKNKKESPEKLVATSENGDKNYSIDFDRNPQPVPLPDICGTK